MSLAEWVKARIAMHRKDKELCPCARKLETCSLCLSRNGAIHELNKLIDAVADWEVIL